MALCAFSLASYAQFGVGLRDTRYVNVNYTLKDRFFFEFEQSIFAEKLGFQYFRVYCGYKGAFGPVNYHANAYYGMAWNNSYRNAGLDLHINYFYRFIGAYGNLNPHYDSLYETKVFFRVGLAGNLTKQLTLKCDYNTIPTYREGEKRIRFGLNFHLANLYVEPLVSIPVEGNDKFKSLRVLVSFNYTFKR